MVLNGCLYKAHSSIQKQLDGAQQNVSEVVEDWKNVRMQEEDFKRGILFNLNSYGRSTRSNAMDKYINLNA